MNIETPTFKVLGASGAIAAGLHTTSFLVGNHVLLDAGTGLCTLTLPELAAIDHVLITHAHLDHVAGLPLMLDAAIKLRTRAAKGPVTIHLLPEVRDQLQTHLFNGALWPDFSRLPTPQAPALIWQTHPIGEAFTLPGLPGRIELLPAEHLVPACGYWIECLALAFTGDTGPSDALAQRLAQLRQEQALNCLIIECAFPDEDEALAHLSGHMHPQALRGFLHMLERACGPAGLPEVWITHIKPCDRPALEAEWQGTQNPSSPATWPLQCKVLAGVEQWPAAGT